MIESNANLTQVEPDATPTSAVPLRVLLIAFSFPPSLEVGALRPSRFCQYLPLFDIEPTVITVQERYHPLTDAGAGPPPGRVVRTGMWENPLVRLARWRSRRLRSDTPDRGGRNGAELVQGQAPSGLHSFKRHLFGLFDTPDRFLGWYFPALRAARELLAHERISLVVSTGPPQTTHLIARRLKRDYGIPWFADFRDPWAYAQSRGSLPWQRTVNRALESRCVREADLVICNTDRMRADFVARYPGVAAKFRTLTNGFDGPLISPAQRADSGEPCLIAHLGSIETPRRIDGFCRALTQLVRAGLLDTRKFRVVLIGSTDEENRGAAARLSPELLASGCFELRPTVGRQEAREWMWKAKVLLVFQGPYQLQVPAKVYEYMQTGTPILAIASEGAVSDLLTSTGAGLCADPDNPREIAEKLLQVMRLPARSPEEVQSLLSSQYDFRVLTERLAGWVKEFAPRGGSR